jgi:hypothetical protein
MEKIMNGELIIEARSLCKAYAKGGERADFIVRMRDGRSEHCGFDQGAHGMTAVLDKRRAAELVG